MTLPTIALIILVILSGIGWKLYQLGKDEGIREGETRAKEGYEKQLKRLGHKLDNEPDSSNNHFGVSQPGQWGKAGETNAPIRLEQPTDDGTSQREPD